MWYKDDDETQIDGAEKVCVFFFFFGTKMIIKAKYTSATFKLSTF